MLLWTPREYTLVLYAHEPVWTRGYVDATDASGPVAPTHHGVDTWWTGLSHYLGILTIFHRGTVTQYYGHPRTYPPVGATRIEQYTRPTHVRVTSTQALKNDTLPSYISPQQITPAIAKQRLGTEARYGVVPMYCLWYAATLVHEDVFGSWKVQWYEVYLQPNIQKLRVRRFYAPVLLHPSWPALAMHGRMHVLGTNDDTRNNERIRQRTYTIWQELAATRYPLAPEQIIKTPVVAYTTLQHKKELRSRLQYTAAAWIGAPLTQALQQYPIPFFHVVPDESEAYTITELLHALGSTQPYETSALTGLLRTARWFAVGYGLTNERSAHVHEARRWFVDAYSDGVSARTYWYTLGAR